MIQEASAPHIWVALLLGDPPPFTLRPSEQALLGPRAVQKRRDDFKRGRFVAHALLEKHTESAQVAVLPDRDGVPWAEHDEQGRLPLSLSISHTWKVAAAASVPLPWRVGVDVERPIESARELIGDYFEPCEEEICGDGNDLPWRAAEIWALKEAGMKAIGKGLRVPTSALVVRSVCRRAKELGWQRVEVELTSTAGQTDKQVEGWVQRREGVVIALVWTGEKGETKQPRLTRPFNAIARSRRPHSFDT